MQTVFSLFLLLSTTGLTSGFAPAVPINQHATTSKTLLSSMEMMSDNNDDNDNNGFISRRKVISDAAIKTVSIAAIVSSTSTSIPSLASAAEGEMGSNELQPISVIGAGGKVGNLCTEVLNQKGLYTRAITRSGRKTLSGDSSFVSYASGDVTNYEAIKKAVDGSSGVIFAASASGKKKGGDPEHVDYLGLYNTAKACIECGVPKLVVVSAGSVTRPDFAGFKATNIFVSYVYGEKIMDHKIAGEAVMRDLYQSTGGSKCSYCVVRPGGLNDGKVKGPSLVHVSQGDVYSAEITRQDVAEVTVAALLKGSATDNTTFELNQQKGLAKVSKDLETPSAELVHNGATLYGDLFDGLLTDSQMKSSYPQYTSDFRGDKIKPISEVV